MRGQVIIAAAALLAAIVVQGAEAAPTGQQTKLVVLGTAGGPQIRLKRAQSTTAITVDGSVYLVDLGDGALHQMAKVGLGQDQVRAVFITLFSQDRICGLTPFLSTRWLIGQKKPLAIYAPIGLKQTLQGVDLSLKAVATSSFVPGADPLIAVTANEISDAGLVYQDENIKVTALALPRPTDPGHPVAFAYRFETPGGSIVFTGATGARDSLADFVKGADVMLSEVSDVDATMKLLATPQTTDAMRQRVIEHIKNNHLVPEQIGELAALAGVKQVVLHHLEPGTDDQIGKIADQAYAAGVRKFYRGPVILPDDLQTLSLAMSAQK